MDAQAYIKFRQDQDAVMARIQRDNDELAKAFCDKLRADIKEKNRRKREYRKERSLWRRAWRRLT